MHAQCVLEIGWFGLGLSFCAQCLNGSALQIFRHLTVDPPQGAPHHRPETAVQEPKGGQQRQGTLHNQSVSLPAAQIHMGSGPQWQ